MTEQAFETRTDQINLSPVAAAKVKSLLEQEGRDDLALRISVQPGGCSGLRYQLFFDERTLDGDMVTDFDGVSVVVDRMSVPYLNGAVIDFVDSIEKQGFTIDNPNADRLLRLRRLVPLRHPPSGATLVQAHEEPPPNGGGSRDFPSLVSARCRWRALAISAVSTGTSIAGVTGRWRVVTGPARGASRGSDRRPGSRRTSRAGWPRRRTEGGGRRRAARSADSCD